ncbi:MAG: XRE family transcriptional regulator [Deferrisomatales bacterium]
MDIGKKLRRLRLQAGLTQEELANRADLTKGFISQLENDATSPSIATLKDILDALGSTLEEFFRGTAGEEKVAFTKDDRVVSGESDGRYTLTFLIPRAHLHEMEPVLVDLQPGEATEPMSGHEGEEFGFVLEGRVSLHVGGGTHKLRKGECFYFGADTEHWLSNPGKRRATVLWVACPPSF